MDWRYGCGNVMVYHQILCDIGQHWQESQGKEGPYHSFRYGPVFIKASLRLFIKCTKALSDLRGKFSHLPEGTKTNIPTLSA